MIRFWNTYLIPSKPNIYGKIDIVNLKLKEWSKDTDIICLQEVFKWRVGLLSMLIFIPLSKIIKSQSTYLLGITIYDGRYQISNIIVFLSSLFILYKKNYKILTSIVLCTLIQNIYFGHFDTLKNLNIPKEYKFITRSEKDYFSTLLDGGKVTLSKTEFIEKTEENFDHSFEGLENSFIKTLVKLNGIEINIYNLHLAPTHNDDRWFSVKYGVYKENYKYDQVKDSKSIRKGQIDELCKNIDKSKINLVIGDFNICKYLDVEEYNYMISSFLEKTMVEIKPKELNSLGLVQGGTFKPLDIEGTTETSREYLDHAFISQSYVDNFEAVFDDYVDKIDHKPCKIMYRK